LIARENSPLVEGIIDFITAHLFTIVLLAVAGIFAGLLAGLLGVGGGIVLVPVLFFLFQALGVSADTAMLVATATSLATIVPTSASSIHAHHKKGNVDFELLKRWAAFIVIGVFMGSWVMTQVDGIWLSRLFGVVAILSALNMLLRTQKSAIFKQLPSRFGQSLLATLIGLISVMVGIGGGTFSVPLLTLCSYPAHRAVGTAAAIGFLIALPGALTLLLVANSPVDVPVGTYGLVNLGSLLCIVPLTVLFAPLGALLASKLNAVHLKRVFAVALLLMGLRMCGSLFMG
jgi:uncharacterized membrane protein YfcA